MMEIAEYMRKMIDGAGANRHDIAHFLKVWGYAKTIAELEQLEPETRKLLEIAAIIHDIACPVCREKYGSAPGRLQEKESPGLVRDFLRDTGLTEEETERIVWLVSHHHTYEPVDGIDHRILLEADYLVNADEGQQTPENIRYMMKRVFRTKAGKQLLASVYGISEEA